MENKKPQSSEIHPGPGFRIQKNINRLSDDLILRFKEFPTPDISDLLNRLYTMSADIHNVVNNKTIVGSACTVKVYPGDNLMVHKSLDIAKPGDIIVVDTLGADRNAVLGDLVAQKAKHRGITGFIVDGLVRDLEGLQYVGLPIFAKGITPIGPLHRGPGEINFPITCGHTVVNPGDLIIADINGVVVVQQNYASELLDRLYLQKARLAEYVENVKKGIFSNQWVDEILEKGNCLYCD